MQRWEQGLKWLGEDLHRWLSGEKNQHTPQSMERGTQSKDNPVFVNNIYNYSNEARTPLKTVRFGFIRTTAIVVFMVAISAITWLLITNPQALVDMWHQFVQLMHSI
ncbi:MAG: hypothetical protein JSW06_04980 [Thermoplasmatales archaeon]|nr:MAG: hypothetical protein JSW06_04980 [Thermoplasmatales archaeon]